MTLCVTCTVVLSPGFSDAIHPGCLGRHRTHIWHSKTFSLPLMRQNGHFHLSNYLLLSREARAPSAAEIRPISAVPACPVVCFTMAISKLMGSGMCIFASLREERHIFKIRKGCSRLNIAVYTYIAPRWWLRTKQFSCGIALCMHSTTTADFSEQMCNGHEDYWV